MRLCKCPHLLSDGHIHRCMGLDVLRCEFGARAVCHPSSSESWTCRGRHVTDCLYCGNGAPDLEPMSLAAAPARPVPAVCRAGPSAGKGVAHSLASTPSPVLTVSSEHHGPQCQGADSAFVHFSQKQTGNLQRSQLPSAKHARKCQSP